MNKTDSKRCEASPEVRNLRIASADGYPLAANWYPALGVNAEQAPKIVVAGATGVPQLFYRRFAVHAAQAGFSVLSFDYRGIGGSAPASLKGFNASYLDWGRLDLSAAIEYASADGAPILIVGHSFGGHAIGMVRRPELIRAACIFGVGAGWSGYMPRMEQLRVWALWNLVFPPLVKLKGYAPWKMLRMGEDIPLGVHRQWRRWCRFPHYFFDDPEIQNVMRQAYSRATFPMVFGNATDDVWASPASRDALVAGYTRADLHTADIDPAPYGQLGHMGYFRGHAQALWDEALGWLAAQDEGRAHVLPFTTDDNASMNQMQYA